MTEQLKIPLNIKIYSVSIILAKNTKKKIKEKEENSVYKIEDKWKWHII